MSLAATTERTAPRVPRFVADLVGYGLVSVVALACDYGLLVGLVAASVHYLVASSIGFSVGMVVAYVLSVRFVFPSRRAASRLVEAIGFFAVGMVGLVLTQGLLWLFVSRLGLGVAAAKVPTTGLVFGFNFLCRRGFVFARAAGRTDEDFRPGRLTPDQIPG